MSTASGKPELSEYGPYFGRYVTLVSGANIVNVLQDQLASTRAVLDAISEEKSNHRYAAGKWSIKELVGHVSDSERVFAYRALRFARNDATELSGFDQDIFAANTNFGNIPMRNIVQEYDAVRRSTLFLLKHLPEGAWMRRGIANKTEVTVRAIAFSIAGHELHHMAILQDRYLK
jgi:hypothetical protein